MLLPIPFIQNMNPLIRLNLLKVNFSLSKIKRLRKKLGWRADATRYCQMIKEKNKPIHLNYALGRIAAKDKFFDAMFSDECTVQMESHGKITFRKWYEQKKYKPKPKHPLKLHVWGAISRRGPSQLAIFDGCANQKMRHFHPKRWMIRPSRGF